MPDTTPLARSGGARGLAAVFRGHRASRWGFGGAGRLTLAVVLIAGVFLASPAAASGEADLAIDDLDCEPTAAELEDIGLIAEQDGIDMAETIARLGWQSCFSEAVDYLQATYPERFAGAAIVDRGLGAWIAFTGQVPDEAVQLAAAIPVAVQLIADRAVSQYELDETLQAVHAEVLRHDEIAAADGSYDLETGKVTMQAQTRETLSEDERERLLETIQPAPPTNPAITIEVVLVDELGGEADEQAASPSRSVPPSVGYAALLTGAATVLLVSLLRARRRRRAMASRGTRAGTTG